MIWHTPYIEVQLVSLQMFYSFHYLNEILSVQIKMLRLIFTLTDTLNLELGLGHFLLVKVTLFLIREFCRHMQNNAWLQICEKQNHTP